MKLGIFSDPVEKKRQNTKLVGVDERKKCIPLFQKKKKKEPIIIFLEGSLRPLVVCPGHKIPTMLLWYLGFLGRVFLRGWPQRWNHKDLQLKEDAQRQNQEDA